MKKAYIIAAGSGVLTLTIGGCVFLNLPKEKIELKIEDNKLMWIDNTNKNVLGGMYHIFNDEFLVNRVTENTYFVTQDKLIDEEGPDKIRKVSISYIDNKITFAWDDVVDIGTDNALSVNLYNENERQLSYSNTVNYNYASGISKYIVEIDGKKYECRGNTFTVDRLDLSDGLNVAKLYAMDLRGNKGGVANVPLYNYKVILSKEEDKVRFHIDDNTQSYKYNLIVDGEDKGEISNDGELNEFLKDTLPPNRVTGVDIKTNGNKADISWNRSEDNGNTYSVRLDACGESYYNTAYSDVLSIEKKSRLKGYLVKVNQNSKHEFVDGDVINENTSMSFEGGYGKYYVHIVAVDNDGNTSSPITVPFELKDPNIIEDKPVVDDSNNNGNSNTNGPSTEDNILSSSEKLKVVKSLLVVDGQYNEIAYDKAVVHMNKLPGDLLLELRDKGLKVYLTSGEAEELYEKFTGKIVEDITGVFVWNDGKIASIVESSYVDSTLLHEIGHVADYVKGGGSFKSSSNSFTKIFNEEKTALFGDNEYHTSSPQEYFAESFLKFYTNKTTLKKKAPKTYEYISDLLS